MRSTRRRGAVYNGKIDLVASNESYGALFPYLVEVDRIRAQRAVADVRPTGKHAADHRSGRGAFTWSPSLRANYASHIGDPAWTELKIDAAPCAASAEFRRFWEAHTIVDPGSPAAKAFECFGLGTVRVRATGFPLQRMLDARMVVYLPDTAADAALIAELRSRVKRRLRPA